ncbi:MAG: hypothetical protein ACI9UK_001564 [Candidatus Krumholzibacteriia bacterium]
MNRNSNTLPAAELEANCLQLNALIDTEESHYRRLLRLAWRQNSYMKRQDVDRLDANASEWSRHLPAADRSRIARERLISQMATNAGVQLPPAQVNDLLDHALPVTKTRIEASLAQLKLTVAHLARQNELNRNLAEFCLDLAHEESKIFKDGVLKDPSGCYGDDAKTADRGPGGFLVKQA